MAHAHIIAMCDIDNPLYGTNGAASVFHRKKAQMPPACRRLTQRLKRGGLGRQGLWNALFWGAELKMGIETVLYSVSFEKNCAAQITYLPEKGDWTVKHCGAKSLWALQSAQKKAGVPVIAVVGDAADGIDCIYELGVSAVVSINRLALPLAEAPKRADADLSHIVTDILRLLRTACFSSPLESNIGVFLP